jgi:hypothetical protein
MRDAWERTARPRATMDRGRYALLVVLFAVGLCALLSAILVL